MKQLILAIALILMFELLLSKCASPKAPTGGPKDTIPPTLVEAYPPSNSLNTNEKEITFIFDENINAQKLEKNLIITPNIDIKYKTLTKRNKLVLKFEEPFPDSTTITLNFFDGLVDNTEGTPAVNLTYVFSTGEFLDSLTVSGEVKDLMTATPKEKILIGLFSYTDTLDLFTSKPTYFTSSDQEGLFQISNIKVGTYTLLAFSDKNKNLLFDTSTEAYGFLTDAIVLDSNVTNLYIPMIKEDASTMRLTSSRSLGNYFDVQYSKGLSSAKLSNNLPYAISENFKSIRMYKPEEFDLADSLQTIITVADSLGNILNDTLSVKFNENTRKKKKFTYNLTPSVEKIDRTENYTLTFNKPVKYFNNTLIHFAKDSTLSLPLDSTTHFHWNTSRTKLSFLATLDTAHYFSLQRELIAAADTISTDTLSLISPNDTLSNDTLSFDSININQNVSRLSKSKKRPLSKKVSTSIKIKFPKETFISIEDDTLGLITKKYSFFKKAETGTIFLTITTKQLYYTIQLIDPSFRVLKEFIGTPKLQIPNVFPGEYGIRILIDENADGKWAIGNILNREEPESVYIYPAFTSVLANWEHELDISF